LTQFYICADQEFAKNVVSLAKSFNIDAQIIGRVEASEKKELVIELGEEKFEF
jgi:phosphoribosylformylglycinamidine cyclo-ligase